MKIYISYSNEDLHRVELLKKTLLKFNIELVYVEHQSIDLNNDCIKNMLEEIKNIEIILFLISDFSNQSSIFSIELVAAIKRKKHIIGLKVDDSNMNENIAFSFNNYPIINEYSFKKSMLKLVKMIESEDSYE